jgi:hypothetical protein
MTIRSCSRSFGALIFSALATIGSYASANDGVSAETLPYKHGETLPEGYRIERTWQSYWVVPSATVLGLSYFFAVSGAAAADFRGPYGTLAIPMAGPFIALTTRETACRQNPDLGPFADVPGLCFSHDDAYMTTALLVDGVAQIVSGALLFVTLRSPTFVFVRKDLASLRVFPTRLDGGHGFAIRGVF